MRKRHHDDGPCGLFDGPLKQGVLRLGECEFFNEFSASARRKVLGFSRLCRLEPENLLFEEGAACEALHLLLDGAVKMNKISANGKEQVVRLVKPGQIFGAAPLFSPQGVYPATAVAVRESQVLSIPKADLIRLLKAEPDLMLKVLSYVAQHLQDMMRLAESMSLDPVPKRVAEHILKLARAAGGPKAGQALLLAQSQTQLAAELGTVREVLGRTLHRLRKEGVLDVKGRQITIRQPGRLAEEAAGRAGD